jgi:hypothetical protein
MDANVAAREAPVPARRAWVRDYPQFAVFAAVLALAILALPSALNLPQANPGQLAEYAPVPGNSNLASSQGNVAGLGLGQGSGPSEGIPPQQQSGSGVQPPSKYQCVGNPPRQTEDPLSPPCVPYYNGDNGGSTWQGVTGSSVTVVFFITCATGANGGTFAPTSQGSESPSCGTWDDLATPVSSSDFVMTRALKIYSIYFNQRYQTYKRFVHMWAYYGTFNTSSSGNESCDSSCVLADATTIWNTRHPFAVILNDVEGWGNMNLVSDYFAQHRTLTLGNDTPQHESVFQQFPGFIWSYSPALEQQAEQFGSWLCQKVVGKPVSVSGDGDIGKPRKLALLYNGQQGQPYIEIINLLKPILQKCGGPGVLADSHAYTGGGSVDGGDDNDAATTLATWQQQEGITSILWIGNQDGGWPRVAHSLNYQPEWFIYGDGVMEDFVTPRWTDQNTYSHAWVWSNVPLVGAPLDQPCATALRSVDPSYPSIDLGYTCLMYNDLRQLFTGVQVAGPTLTPQSIDTGFHAIPGNPSSNPEVPACYYAEGDYTCVKDAVAMWWDPNGTIQGYSGSGCWRLPSGGARYRAWTWPGGNVEAQQNKSADPCNGYTANGSFNPYQQ